MSPKGQGDIDGQSQLSLEAAMNCGTRRAVMIVACLLAHIARQPSARGQALATSAGGRVPETGVILPAGAVQPAATPTRRLSVDQAVALALKNNLGIRSERYGPQIQDMVVADPRSVGLPTRPSTCCRRRPSSTASTRR